MKWTYRSSGSVQEMGLEIDMIAPDHGVIWRDPGRIINAYSEWSSHKARKKALVIYDTMWHSTEMMAKAVADGIQDEGVSVDLLDLTVNHRSEIMASVLDAKAIVLGSPTLNNGLLPRMAGFLMYMRGLKPANKIGAAFGSYGWSGEAVKELNGLLEGMKVELVADGLRTVYVPDEKALEEAVNLGRTVGRRVMELAGDQG